MITTNKAEKSVTRNTSFFKKIPSSTLASSTVSDGKNDAEENFPAQAIEIAVPYC